MKMKKNLDFFKSLMYLLQILNHVIQFRVQVINSVKAKQSARYQSLLSLQINNDISKCLVYFLNVIH